MNASNTSKVDKSLNRLSTGLRINSAADDAAGLCISEKMRSQIRGLQQASRNIQDGISLVQVADAALSEVSSLMHRGRELTIQASTSTLTAEDKGSLQNEMSQILTEVDRISATTNFNGIKVLNLQQSDDANIVLGLQSSWLSQSEQLISNYYGLTGDNASLKVVLESTNQPYLAAISYNLDGNGKATNEELHIDVAAFSPAALPNGGSAPMYDDRIISHEMVHAIMGRNMNFGALSNWFKEGTAEFIHGADERLYNDVMSAGSGVFSNGAIDIVSEISSWSSNDSGDPGWNVSWDYSSAYAAVRYLHDQIKTAGGQGIKDVMSYLSANPGSTLDNALSSLNSTHPSLNFNSEASFLNDFSTNGVAYISSMNFSNADTGAIGGFDADGGAIRTSTQVVPDVNIPALQPMTGFNIIWPSNIESGSLEIMVAANTNSTISLGLVKANTKTLGIENINITKDAKDQIALFDNAIQTVSSFRASFGAFQNRLEHTLTYAQNSLENLTASESRISDADMALEQMDFTKNNILSQAAMSMLAQANQQPQAILQLLK